MRPQAETRVLPVMLSPEQLAAKAQELAVAVVDADEQKRVLAHEAEGWKLKKKALESELDRRERVATQLAAVVETGMEEQSVPCNWLYALEVGWAFLVRSDTGELVTKRQLEGAERQENLVEVLQEPTPEQLAEWLANPEEAPDPMGEELAAIAADGFQAGPGEEAADPELLEASAGLETAGA